LRVLQERCVQPLGSSEQYPVDIRLISATNRNLREQVQAGHFRQDLYYRISGLNLELPPLRQRTDKAALIHRLWEQHRDAEQHAGFESKVLALFEEHPWPGNLRQLSNVIQVALALADEQPISVEHLPDDFFADLEWPNPVGARLDRESAVEATVGATLVARASIALPAEAGPTASLASPDLNDLLQATGGNISQLAKRLGVSRNTLYKRLREKGV